MTSGKLKTRYLKIVDIDDGKATTIVDAITSNLQSSGLDLNNWRAGASQPSRATGTIFL